jgi:type 1 glutamine amidotransferase
MTDTMYNPRKSPYVPHCIGTELMIEHVEKYWCPTIASTAFLGGDEFRFKEDRRPRIVFLIGEDEYKTWETLPAFATNDLAWRGFQLSIVQQSPDDKHRFPGFTEAMREADLLFVSLRRRALPKDQLDLVRAHLQAGKPLIGIRTACHAFAPRGADASHGDAWPTFDPDVLGGNYDNHWGAGPRTTVTVSANATGDELLSGVDVAQLVGNGSLYKVSPLKPAAKTLLTGSIPDKPAEPIAWTHSYGPNHARIFYTSLGHWDDFAEPAFRRLLLNATLWAVGQSPPPK